MNQEQQNTKPTNQNQNDSAKQRFWERHRLILKVGIIAILIILLLIPKSMVDDLISERQYRSYEAQDEVNTKWGSEQQIIGPILTINNNTKKYNGENIYILPQSLDINAKLKSQTLKRGMYDMVVYSTEVIIKGSFALEDEIYKDGKLLIDSSAVINVALSDLRGLTQQVALDWGGDNLTLVSGINSCHIASMGVNTPINLNSFVTNNNNVEFTLKLSFNGSRSIMFAPLGLNTTTTVSSNYTNPSFDGEFLPQTRQVTDSGFTASWKVLNINRNYPQLFTGTYHLGQIENSLFGVNLLTPVDQYQQATRTVKYAFLIIILTFVLSFFIEVIQRRNIHPMQYLLIGLTLCLFYSLLISISEHIGFELAYLISSIMTVAMITLYMMGVLRIRRTAFTIGGVLAGLYGYIYTLIQMESYALVTGSIGLFVIMACIMYFSLKIKWGDK